METLQTRVQREGPLDAKDAVGWLIRLGKRVEELHRMGVAHGGLSAGCILTEGRNVKARGLLADVRQAAMRPSYHCPERIAGGGISPADDTWAMAVTLYYLLTGAMPFPGETSAEIRQRMANTPPSPLAVFDAGDDELQQLLDRFLHRFPAERQRRLPDLVVALERWHRARGGSALPALEEAEDDSLSDADDEEQIATVMRDISSVRAQLEQLQKSQGLTPPGGAPRVGQPRGAATPGANVKAPAVPPARGSGPGIPPARGSGPGIVGPPVAAGSGPGVPPPPPPSGPGAGYRSPEPIKPRYPIDDEDSDEQSTMLMDTEGALGDAIQAAVEAKRAREAGAWPDHGIQDDDSDVGGAATVLMTEEMQQLDLSGIPDPTGGPEPVAGGEPVSAQPESLPAPPSIEDPPTFGDAHDLAAIGESLEAVAAQAPSPPTMQLPEQGGYVSEVDKILAGQGQPPPGAAPAAAPPQNAKKGGGAVRVALIVASVLLVLVVAWIGLLLAERAGLVQLPI